jgi:hypothetical protein
LIRARIPYLPVHIDHLDRDSDQFSTIILPNLGAVSDAQLASIRRFVARGGGLVATDLSTLFNEWGEPREDFGLANLFGARAVDVGRLADEGRRRRAASETVHTYLRLSPELRARVDGPREPNPPVPSGQRHEVLQGFEATDILPFGGGLEPLRVVEGAHVPATFIPSFPIYPPETAWMREPRTDIAGIVLNTMASGARIAFLPADIDRRFARDNLPDHGDLLANVVRWTAQQNIPLRVQGPGLVDCHLYQQDSRLVLHLVNLTSAATWRQPVHEFISVGPLHVEVKVPPQVRRSRVRLLVAEKAVDCRLTRGWARFAVPSILDHEVVVIG